MNQPEIRGPIDWDAIWEELNWDAPERRDRALRDRLRLRARQYAAPLAHVSAASERLTLLSFNVSGERYAVDVARVRGVRPTGRIARVPGVPSFYSGVVNVRGQIISVLNLRRFLDAGDSYDEMPREMVLAAAQGLELGLLADHVEEVVSIPREMIEPVDSPFARGIGPGRLAILDLDAIFADERLMVGGMDENA